MLKGKVNPKDVLAVIPARGGSKGIPKKNIYPVSGKPLLAYVIQSALKTDAIGSVVVSTDDNDIASVAVEYGAEVVWRPAELSTDKASSESALLHALEYLKRRDGTLPEIMAFLQCTSPLTQPQDIQGTIETLVRDNMDSVLTVAKNHGFLWRINDGGEAIGINHDKKVRQRRQDLKPEFLETGALYVMKTDGFITARHRFFGKTGLYVVPGERALQIDNLYEVEMVESIMRYYDKKNK